MAETINISKLAEIISEEIFLEFGWTKFGPTNVNWNCVDHEKHKKDSHPSDVVFYYDEPFKAVRTYVQTDLKSYATTSITKGALEGAILSLAMQISCANISEEWHSKYTQSHVNYDICGMLFVYNHDGGYDRELIDLIEKIDLSKVDMPENSKIFIVTPVQIFWLYNVSQNLMKMRGKSGSDIPAREKCSFFYPQPIQKVFFREGEVTAANLETLTSSIIIMKYTRKSPHVGTGYIIFYQGDDQTEECYLYLIDFIRSREMLQEGNIVRIRSIDKSGNVLGKFQKARHRYIEQFGGDPEGDGTSKLIRDIEYELMSHTTAPFTAESVGFDYDR